MKKLTTLAAIGFAVLPISARAQSADAIIDRAVAAYARLNSMRAEFTQTLTNPLTGNSQTTSGVILRKKPNLLSITFESGDRVAADGSTLWVFLPSSVPGQVMRMPANVSGRATHAVTLVPKRANAGFTSAKVWIDDADSSIRQFDVESANGLKRHVVITSFTPNPELSKSTFRFAVPKGAKIVDQSQMSGVAY